MVDHSTLESYVLTGLLRHRLAHTVSFNINIIEEQVAFAASNLSNHNGTHIGFLMRRPDRSFMFVLLIKPDIDDGRPTLALFYLNTKFQDIKKSETDLLTKRIPQGTRISIVNIKTTVPSFSHPSLLLALVEWSIVSRLFNEYRPIIPIRTYGGSRFVVSNPQPYPSCRIDAYGSEAIVVINLMRRLRLKLVSFDCDHPTPIPAEFDILRIVIDRHLVYGINYPEYRLLMILLPHPMQFRTAQMLNDTKNLLQEYSAEAWAHIGPMRYHSEPTLQCNSSEILKACIMALAQPFVNLSSKDIDAMMPDSQLNSIAAAIAQSAPLFRAASPAADLPEDENLDEACDDATIEVVNVDSCSTGDRAEFVSSQRSNPSIQSGASQPSLALYEAEILAETRRMDACLGLRNLVANYNYPLKNEVTPMSDPNGSILNNTAFFLADLEWMADLCNAHTTAAMTPALDPAMLDDAITINEEGATRFLIIPILAEGFDAVLVVDRQNEEWGYINPNNEATDADVFADISNVATKTCSQFRDYVGMPITITSHFHKEYPKMHLLMAVFHLAKLFRYAKILPRKIIYRECDFRAFCDQLIAELRVANMNYNLERGYIKPDGYIASGGYISPTSSNVQFERSIVPSDQCNFCLKRGYNNLANHMSMKHGGLATTNAARRWS
jgi:hypothetical protein